MICLFDNKAEKLDLIETNGDYILDPICTDAIITEELNGEYSLDADFIIDKKSHIDYDMICEDSLIKIDDEYGKEYFRIAKVTKTTRRVTIFARHITISDILTMFCEDVRPEGQTGAGAISWIFDNASGKKWFNVSSDIPTLSTAYYVNKNVYEALFTADNSFLDRWGGETYRRGFNIAINQRVGADRGVQIRSKKNLTGFEASTNINSLITRIYPKGYNGITIDEKYIDSKYINNYSSIFAKEVKFEGVKVIEEGEEGEGYKTLEEAQNELKRLVNELYEVDKVDLITATYRINFVQLEKTEEYKNYSILERTWLGDTIEVIEDTLGINITVRVLKRKYDVIKGKRLETELSNKDTKEKPPTIQQVINKIEKLPTIENVMQIARDEATALINAGINGFVVCNKNEILIMDTPDKNTAINVWRWNINGLGHSKTGYYGQFETALTADGKIVLNEVTCEAINAILIKGGSIIGFNSNLKMDLEEDRFSFNHSGASTKTVIDEKGFYIEDEEGEIIASLASKESWSELKADKVFAKNIENVYLGDSNLYVDHSYIGETDGTIDKPFKSFEDLRGYLSLTRIINNTLTINILSTGNITEGLVLDGIRGNGNINFKFANGGKYQGEETRESGIKLSNIKIPVTIRGGCLFNNFLHGALFYNCEYVNIENTIFNVPNWGCYFQNSNGRVCSVDFADSWNPICAVDSSVVYTHTTACNGRGERFRVASGGIIIYGTNVVTACPKGTDTNYGGVIHKAGEVSANDSWNFPPSNPVSPPAGNMSYNQSFNATSFATYQYSWSNWKNGECKSGVYSSYGDKAGHIFFDLSAVRSFLNSGSIIDGATITLTRANNGGSSGGVNISVGGSSCSGASGTPNYSNKGGVGSLSWGQTNTFTLNKAIVEGIKNGTINSITTHGSGYSNITSCSINLKISK